MPAILRSTAETLQFLRRSEQNYFFQQCGEDRDRSVVSAWCSPLTGYVSANCPDGS
jgi:hypothetical protein